MNNSIEILFSAMHCVRKIKKTVVLLVLLWCGLSILNAQNASWGTGLAVTASSSGSYINLSAYDPYTSQNSTTSLYVGSNAVFKNADGLVVGYGGGNTMYYATYDVVKHVWMTSSTYVGSGGTVATANGVAVGYGSGNTMYYVTYNPRLQKWCESSVYIGSGGSIVTADGVVAGYGSGNTMYYATYNPEQDIWESSSNYIGSGAVVITSNGVVAGYGSSNTMFFASYDISTGNWVSSSVYIGSGGVISTSGGVVAGYGTSNALYYAIYDFNTRSWRSGSTSISSGSNVSITGGTVIYSGSSSGSVGYNSNSRNWGSSPTNVSCRILPVRYSDSNWVYMRCMTNGASGFTYVCGDGHQISRRQGWKRYSQSKTFDITLNVANDYSSSSCTETVNITTGIKDIAVEAFGVCQSAGEKLAVNCSGMHPSLKLFSQSGVLIMDQQLSTGSNQIILNKLPGGVYLLHLNDENTSKTIKYIQP